MHALQCQYFVCVWSSLMFDILNMHHCGMDVPHALYAAQRVRRVAFATRAPFFRSAVGLAGDCEQHQRDGVCTKLSASTATRYTHWLSLAVFQPL